ncbi:MAG: hypothetical protein AVO39_02650 [delta proteobacterium MLS_D]|nr:MAG: hypothetical protein AVO39_02650 [delta proteobacterium MLS_D]
MWNSLSRLRTTVTVVFEAGGRNIGFKGYAGSEDKPAHLRPSNRQVDAGPLAILKNNSDAIHLPRPGKKGIRK